MRFIASATQAQALHLGPADALAVWGSTLPAGVQALRDRTGARLLRVEDGFIRSVGLGSDLVPPLSLIMDSAGIHFDPGKVSDLELMLQHVEVPDELRCRAAAIRGFITRHGLTKYNVEPCRPARWPHGGRPVLLVPGQVEADASLRCGALRIRSNLALVAAVRAARPDACLVYKPHPDVRAGNRKPGSPNAAIAALADVVEDDLSIGSCIEAADEVHVMTSQCGFDALLRNKRVATYGVPFYAGWGLTVDRAGMHPAFRRRTRRRSLDELVAITLLYYPQYWHPGTGQPGNCEAVLHWLLQQREALAGSGALARLRDGRWRHLCRKLGVVLPALLARYG